MLSDFLGRPLPERKPRGAKAVSKEPAEVARARKALTRRWKHVEREFARWLIKHDGPDPRHRGLTTSTGRIGDLTHLQADCLSMTYLGEVKNEKAPVKLLRYWQKINQRALDWGKDAVLYWKPPEAGDFPVNGRPLPALHIITEARHEELLRKEKAYDMEHAA